MIGRNVMAVGLSGARRRIGQVYAVGELHRLPGGKHDKVDGDIGAFADQVHHLDRARFEATFDRRLALEPHRLERRADIDLAVRRHEHQTAPGETRGTSSNGGTEYALGWLPGLFWKNEYRWAEYNSRTDTVVCTSAALCGVAGPTAFAERNRPSVQTVRTELVWRFNWGGGPVAARY